MIMLIFAASAAASADPAGQQTMWALALVIVLVGVWLGVLWFTRSLRARKTEAATGGRFADFALHALVSAARIDGRVEEAERTAIAAALAEAGVSIEPAALASAFDAARLSKDELVAYLTARSGQFSREQKMALLKALLAVFVADGRFDESEHAALVDYTAAVGFDRSGAPQMLRALAGDVKRGSII